MNVQDAIDLITEQLQAPPHKIRLPVNVRHVRDADTVTVVISGAYEWAIRLEDCWAPERDTPKGKRAKAFAVDVLNNADMVEVLIDGAQLITEGDEPVNVLKKIATFDRLVGHLVIDQQDTLSEMLVRAGHATRTKAG